MYKKEMTFKDYNGEERTVKLYFNIDAAELSNMQASTGTPGGYKAMIERMIESKDTNTLIKVVQDLIRVSYGVKEEGSRFGSVFVKKPEYLDEFTHSPVYSDFYMMLVTNDAELSKFVNSVLSANIAEQIEQYKKENPTAAAEIAKLSSET